MRRLLLLSVLLLVVSVSKAQTVVNFSMLQKNRNVEITFELKDATTDEPLSWASAYVVPVGDTTIVSFALSDDKGKVVLEDVPVGRYVLNVELIGYLSYQKEHNFNGWGIDLGVIEMEENPEWIDAATISAVGNPIEIKNDTIIYNASAFRVGENDMLDELLKKMPGMEVGEDGTVKVNGEAVDKITVGGKTFFFNDPSIALKNLPAKIVDKIKVVDKTKDDVAFTGVSTQDDKEKVMDVQLKQEYTKGWFGNAKLGAGVSVNPDKKNELVEDGKFLYDGNVLLTGYTEKDQIVVLGNGYNVMDASANVMVFNTSSGISQDDYSKLGGIVTNAQGGVNYNTDRITGSSFNTSAVYKHNTKDDRKNTSRVSFQSSGEDIYTDTKYEGFGYEDGVNVTLELKKKDRSKFTYDFCPTFSYFKNRVQTSTLSKTFTDNDTLNTSKSNISANNSKVATNGFLNLGVKDLGKEKRSLSLYVSYNIATADGEKQESSSVNNSFKDLFYDIDKENYSIYGSLSYVEPIGRRWLFRGGVSSSYNFSQESQLAYNDLKVLDDNYSVLSDNVYLDEELRLLVQYDNDTNNVQFGVTGQFVQNVIKSRSLGVESVTGQGDWNFNFSPFVNYNFSRGGSNAHLFYSTSVNEVSGDKIIPALDLTNPIQIEAGNIYLKPTVDNNLSMSYSFNNKKTFTFLNLFAYAAMANNPIVTASWFDQEGVRYAIPVNSTRPGGDVTLYLNLNQPFGKNKNFSASLTGSFTYSGNTSYQAAGQLDGLDLDNFDYYEFMDGFWGDASGERFYSGESGFRESRTNTFLWRANLSLKYIGEKFETAIRVATQNRISRYTIDPTANLNTWDNRVANDILYRPGKGWELSNNLSYVFYNGYSSGFGAPEFLWNFSVSKTIKNFTLELGVRDILNQSRSLNRISSAEYSEDTYSNVIGRYFMFSVSFNFGKMNAKKNSAVEDAMWNMMY